VTLRTRTLVWSAGLTAVLAAVLVISAGTGPVSIPPATVARALLSADPLPLGFEAPRTSRIIVLDVRLPRIALAAFVGVALATAGTVMQGFFRNPMADPSIIGVSSGAAVGAVARSRSGWNSKGRRFSPPSSPRSRSTSSRHGAGRRRPRRFCSRASPSRRFSARSSRCYSSTAARASDESSTG